MRWLIEELKRRNVLRAAALYAAGAWVLVQIATQVFPFFDIPNWAVRQVVVAALVGFPFALVISWFYEFTLSGFRREVEPGQAGSGGNSGSIWRNRAFRLALLSASGIALAFLIAAGLVSRRADPAPAAAVPSIAVLPFRNLSADADNAYFAEGLQDEILTRLTQIGALRVISRTSTARYTGGAAALPKIAAQLAVDNVLEGSVQRLADTVRINVQLVRASTGINVWSSSYDRKLSDLFGVESEVAHAVAASLQATLSGKELRDLDTVPTANGEAYDQYLRGLALDTRSFEPAELQRAAPFLRRAVELDPGFAQAWALLSQVDAKIAYQGLDAAPGLCDSAGAEAAQALRLRPELGKAQLAQGFYLYLCRGDLDGAQAAFEQARLLLPGSPGVLEAMGNVERRRGAADQAVAYFRQALVLDPRNTELLANCAMTLVLLRRFDEAQGLADKALNVTPDDASLIALQVYGEQAQGQLEQAQKLLAPLPANTQEVDVFDYQILQRLYQRRPAEAIALLRQALSRDLGGAGLSAADYYYLLGVALRAQGDAEGARRGFAEGQGYLARFPDAAQTPDGRSYRNAMLCLLAAGAGEPAGGDAACRALAAVAASGDPIALGAREALARAAALRGDADTVAAALPGLLRASYLSFLYSTPLTPALLRQDPVWDGVRADPRFKALAGAG
jgi:TolB-like protein